MELVSGVPLMKSVKSETPEAMPLKTKVPRGSVWVK